MAAEKPSKPFGLEGFLNMELFIIYLLVEDELLEKSIDIC